MVDFRGASAGAVSALTDQLKAGAASADLAGELFAVAGLLRSDPALRRFVADPTVAGEAKKALVEQVFGGKVSASAQALLISAVEQRWTRAGDIPNAVERLSEVATILSAPDHRTLVDELFGIGRTVQGNLAVRDALTDPHRTNEDKAGLLANILGSSVSPAALTLTQQALNGTHGSVQHALDTYRRLAAEVNGEGVATVSVAAPLTDEQHTRLGAALARLYGRAIHTNTVVDPAVVGGVKVEIGDDVIDGTIASRLDDAGRLLAG